MSLPSKQFKQEIEFVVIFIEKHSTTFLTTTTAFSRNVLVQGSSVLQKIGSSRRANKKAF